MADEILDETSKPVSRRRFTNNRRGWRRRRCLRQLSPPFLSAQPVAARARHAHRQQPALAMPGVKAIVTADDVRAPADSITGNGAVIKANKWTERGFTREPSTRIFVDGRHCAMRSISRLFFGVVALLGAAGCAKAQEKAPPPQTQAQQADARQAVADWRERMQKHHSADRSIEQQVHRLTKDLDLAPEQQEKVRQLSKKRNDTIQKILDTAPPTLITQEAFTAQVLALSHEYHDAVNAILTPHQLELMKAIVGRLDNGKEDRHAP
jgi:hypothetical protein